MQTLREKNVIILFTRYPVVGKVKTRLMADIGAEAAADMHTAMTAFALRQMVECCEKTSCTVEIHYTGGSHEQMQAWLGEQHVYVEQQAGDLGQRMYAAFASAFTRGAHKVLLMGSDCPDNRASNLQDAFSLLDTSPCVFGPTLDGGYYLVGLRSLRKDIFENISWGTEKVLEQSLAKVTQCALLSKFQDVDYVQDIPEKISVIIPSYNEEKNILKTIQSVQQGFHVEIIVADGGSSDATCAVAQKAGARVYVCPKEQRGRARQMNYGASMATGSIVLFLHADSLLPVQWDQYIRKALMQNSVQLGFFTFAVDGDFLGKKALIWGTNIRAKYFHKPYGDQGFFLRKKDFYSLGAYADVPILEDLYLAKAAKVRGEHVCIPVPIITSSRRWQKHGPLRVTLFNQWVLLAAACGMDLHKVRAAYARGSFWLR